jgi:hypothetical protein
MGSAWLRYQRFTNGIVSWGWAICVWTTTRHLHVPFGDPLNNALEWEPPNVVDIYQRWTWQFSASTMLAFWIFTPFVHQIKKTHESNDIWTLLSSFAGSWGHFLFPRDKNQGRSPGNNTGTPRFEGPAIIHQEMDLPGTRVPTSWQLWAKSDMNSTTGHFLRLFQLLHHGQVSWSADVAKSK